VGGWGEGDVGEGAKRKRSACFRTIIKLSNEYSSFIHLILFQIRVKFKLIDDNQAE